MGGHRAEGYPPYRPAVAPPTVPVMSGPDAHTSDGAPQTEVRPSSDYEAYLAARSRYLRRLSADTEVRRLESSWALDAAEPPRPPA